VTLQPPCTHADQQHLQASGFAVAITPGKLQRMASLTREQRIATRLPSHERGLFGRLHGICGAPCRKRRNVSQTISTQSQLSSPASLLQQQNSRRLHSPVVEKVPPGLQVAVGGVGDGPKPGAHVAWQVCPSARLQPPTGHENDGAGLVGSPVQSALATTGLLHAPQRTFHVPYGPQTAVGAEGEGSPWVHVALHVRPGVP
jgi:hypothetical protein